MSIIKVKWDDIAKRIKEINPKAHEILDADPDIRNHTFEIWQYKYGDVVGDDTGHFLPDGTRVDANIPFGMFLSKQFDFYLNNTPIQINYSYKAGDFIFTSYITNDVSHYYSPSDFWIGAGTIEPLFASRVADEKRHRALNEHFDTHITRPYFNHLHFNTIKEIASYVAPDWRAEFLRFPQQWATMVRESKAHPFKDLIYQFMFKRTAYDRHSHYYQHLLSKVRRNYTETVFQNAYANQIIMHLFFALCGHIPIHTFATDDTALPLAAIQQAYLDIYQTTQVPLILIPSLFNKNPEQMHYFSVAHHTESYKPNSVNNALKLCADIKYIVQIYADVFKNVTRPYNHLFYDITQNIHIDIIHERKGALHSQGKAYMLNEIDQLDPICKAQLEDFREKGYDLTP
ncbi:hypothetical protein, partial [Facilibium subflavum]|uniref:hypothetical protein n=1 Tax=Facilibium subflavum TaxID=2219058 RepID=UPI0013C2AD16